MPEGLVGFAPNELCGGCLLLLWSVLVTCPYSCLTFQFGDQLQCFVFLLIFLLVIINFIILPHFCLFSNQTVFSFSHLI